MTEEQLEHPAVLNFVSELRDTFSGDFIDTSLSKGKPFIFKPILNLLNDPEKVKDEKGYTLREDVLECVHEVNFYFSSVSKNVCIAKITINNFCIVLLCRKNRYCAW